MSVLFLLSENVHLQELPTWAYSRALWSINCTLQFSFKASFMFEFI